MGNLSVRVQKLEKAQRSEAEDTGQVAKFFHDLAKVYGEPGEQVDTNITMTPAEFRKSIKDTIEKVYHDDTTN